MGTSVQEMQMIVERDKTRDKRKRCIGYIVTIKIRNPKSEVPNPKNGGRGKGGLEEERVGA
jgi:hypothetical protein